jgi:hypothetical protein
MHSILQSITVDLRKLEKRDLTLDLQNAVNAAKVIVESYQAKLNKGLAFTADDERVLNALLIIVVYMVKDSSITLNAAKVM